MDRTLSWTVIGNHSGLPRRVLTAAVPSRLGALDPLDALLLPATPGPAVTGPEAVTGDPATAVGRFLAHPFDKAATLAARVRAGGHGWLCNFPSVDRHDPEFVSFLSDVDLSTEREERVLRVAREGGLRVMLAMSRPRPVDWRPDAVLLVPPVGGTAPRAGSVRALGLDVPILSSAPDPDADALLAAPEVAAPLPAPAWPAGA